MEETRAEDFSLHVGRLALCLFVFDIERFVIDHATRIEILVVLYQPSPG